jgi:hypothetical protein
VRGWASWPRNPATCASAHAPVHGEHGGGGADWAGPRRRERRGDARGNGLATGEPGPRDRERERAGEGNWRRQVGPSGQRARERARGRGELSLTGGVSLSRGAGTRARDLVGPSCAAFSFSFSLNFLIPFLFLFSKVFNSKFKLGFKFK